MWENDAACQATSTTFRVTSAAVGALGHESGWKWEELWPLVARPLSFSLSPPQVIVSPKRPFLKRQNSVSQKGTSSRMALKNLSEPECLDFGWWMQFVSSVILCFCLKAGVLTKTAKITIWWWFYPVRLCSSDPEVDENDKWRVSLGQARFFFTFLPAGSQEWVLKVPKRGLWNAAGPQSPDPEIRRFHRKGAFFSR